MVDTLNEGEICIRGSKYRIISQDESNAQGDSVISSETSYAPQSGIADSERLDTLINKVDALVNVMGTGSATGGYRSVNLTLPPREQKYQVILGLLSNQIHIRADQGLTVNMNSQFGEDIFIEIAEFPFSLSDLHKNESIHTLYFTTGSNTTHIKILAVGMVY